MTRPAGTANGLRCFFHLWNFDTLGNCTGMTRPEGYSKVGLQPESCSLRGIRTEIHLGMVFVNLDDGAMVGPLPPTGIAKPHPIRVDPAPFDNGRLCGHCHQGTLAQWRGSPLGERRQCSDCHMPAVTRKMTQSTSLISKPIVAAVTANTATAAVARRILFMHVLLPRR